MNINLREKMHNILSLYGHDVIYVRRIPDIHCKCWNEKEYAGSPDCVLCLGVGTKISFEVLRVRSRLFSPTDNSMSNLLNYESPGIYIQPSYFFYMEYNTNPVSEDLIVDVLWENDKPAHVIMPYKISFPEPLRGDNGRIEYWRVPAKSLSHINRDMYLETFRRYNVVRKRT